MADPSAPSVGTTSPVPQQQATNDSNYHMDDRTNTHSPVHDSYPPSPTTSTGYSQYNNNTNMQPMSSALAASSTMSVNNRSVASIHEQPMQQPVSPKLPQMQQQQTPPRPTTPKQSIQQQQSIPKSSSASIQQQPCKSFALSMRIFYVY